MSTPSNSDAGAPALSAIAPGVVASNAPAAPSLYPQQYYYAAAPNAGAPGQQPMPQWNAGSYAPMSYIALPPQVDAAGQPMSMPMTMAPATYPAVQPAIYAAEVAPAAPVEHDTLWLTKVTIRNSELLAMMLVVLYTLIGFWPFLFYLVVPLVGFCSVRDRCVRSKQRCGLMAYMTLKVMAFITYAVLLGIIMGAGWSTNFFAGMATTVGFSLFVLSQVIGMKAIQRRRCALLESANCPNDVESVEPSVVSISNGSDSVQLQSMPPQAMPAGMTPSPYMVSGMPSSPYMMAPGTMMAPGMPQVVYHPAVGQMVALPMPPGAQQPGTTYPGSL